MGESDSDQDPYAPPEAGLEGEESKQLGRIELYRVFITGSKDLEERYVAVERYIERFRRRDKVGGIRPGWHWPAFFVAVPWLVYRRMYLVAVLYFILAAILNGFAPDPTTIAPTELSNQDVALITSVIILNLLITMYANTLYWRRTNRMIRRAKFADPRDQIVWLRKKGGTSSVWLVVLAVVIMPLSSLLGF